MIADIEKVKKDGAISALQRQVTYGMRKAIEYLEAAIVEFNTFPTNPEKVDLYVKSALECIDNSAQFRAALQSTSNEEQK